MASSISLLLCQPHYSLCIRLPNRCSSFKFDLLFSKPIRAKTKTFSVQWLHTAATSPPSRSSLALSAESPRSFSQFQSRSSIPNTEQIPSLHHFFPKAAPSAAGIIHAFDIEANQETTTSPDNVPRGRIYHETYGCQMNVNDMEIVLSIMKKAGYTEVVDSPETAEIILINTCAIRENAEQKVWQRLNYFWFLKRQWKTNISKGRSHSTHPPKVAVLGCMAERLKEKILDAEKMVDVVCGPDAYRDLPRLLADVDSGHNAINTLLSLEETYADITPVRIAKNSTSAFVSIMRGCNNMCSFCIVPFTRGRERSRPVESIISEVRELQKANIKEVTLLGQNVNSYNDTSDFSNYPNPSTEWKLSLGFSSKCKVKQVGFRFSDLLDRVATEFPEIRFRFTSPHPKDFPDELLTIMRDHPNICKSIHLPAQSGSNSVLDRMRRGYTRESYLGLVRKIREVVPDIGLSSDFISGFCGETEEEHSDTVSLIRSVGFDMAYMFAYSMREKTHAHRSYVDDVAEDVKKRRLAEVIEAFRESTAECYLGKVGTRQLVLVEGVNRRAPETEVVGRSDRGHRVCFRNLPVPDWVDREGDRVAKVGDFVEVLITNASTATLFGDAVGITKLSSFYKRS